MFRLPLRGKLGNRLDVGTEPGEQSPLFDGLTGQLDDGVTVDGGDLVAVVLDAR